MRKLRKEIKSDILRVIGFDVAFDLDAFFINLNSGRHFKGEVCPSDKMLEITVGSGKNKTTLQSGKDFVIEGYSKNTKIGRATMTIRGVGKYGGTKTVKYTILPKWMKR